MASLAGDDNSCSDRIPGRSAQPAQVSGCRLPLDGLGDVLSRGAVSHRPRSSKGLCCPVSPNVRFATHGWSASQHHHQM